MNFERSFAKFVEGMCVFFLEDPPKIGQERLWTIALGLVMLLAAIMGCEAHQSDNPFAGEHFYVDPDSSAREQADEWRSSKPEDARQMDKISKEPTAFWFGDDSSEQVRARTDELVTRVTDAGTLPVLVAYNIPYRDCNQYSTGGVSDASAYKNWGSGSFHVVFKQSQL